MKFIDIPEEERKAILDSLQSNIGLQTAIIEKDWWVTAVLRALFMLPYAPYLSFKGGTSLSKCWNLIERMSEDIDIGITREFLGFAGKLSKTQVSDKLRRAACSFVRDKMQYDLKEQLLKNGVDPEQFNVRVDITPISTTDPEVIWVEYKSVAEKLDYIPSVVKIEISGRSMSEPISEAEIESMIDKAAPNAVFREPGFKVRAVLAKRTFLEKIFLLHEEFAKPQNQIRIERMSRHIYDIHRMLSTPIAKEAVGDDELYNDVIEHRRAFIGLKGFDYNSLAKPKLNIIPPASVYDAWKADYDKMQKDMIYSAPITFETIIEDLRSFNNEINQSK